MKINYSIKKWDVNSVSLFSLIELLAWTTVLLIVVGPRQFLNLPFSLNLYDLTTLFLFLLVVFRLSNTKSFPITNDKLIPLFFLYVLIILVFPLIGILYFQNYVSWYLGDLRWLNILVVFISFWLCYSNRRELFEKRIKEFIWFVIVFQFPFIFFQVLLAGSGVSPSLLLEIWYPGGETGYGHYGQHIGRFAGAMGLASALALVSGIGFLYASFNLINRPNYWDIVLLFLSGTLMLAAGNRAMLFAIPVVVIAVFLWTLISKKKIKKKLVTFNIYIIPIALVVGSVLSYYNIGRIGNSNRYIQVYAWLTGTTTFHDISGRGDELWSAPLEEAFSEWSPLGTLVNSAHALGHHPTIDSYIVTAIAQAGPFLILPFVILLVVLIYRNMKLINQNISLALESLAMVVPISISAITQNTMTSLNGRVFLMLSVLLLICAGKKQRTLPKFTKIELKKTKNSNETS